jgi:hypothetical protein
MYILTVCPQNLQLTFSSLEKSDTKYMWMPSIVCQDVIILNASPSGDVHKLGMFWCKNTVLLTIRFFGVAKFSTLTSFMLLFSHKPSLPIIHSKISSVPSFAFRPFDRLFLWCLVQNEVPPLIHHGNCPLSHHFYPHGGRGCSFRTTTTNKQTNTNTKNTSNFIALYMTSCN